VFNNVSRLRIQKDCLIKIRGDAIAKYSFAYRATIRLHDLTLGYNRVIARHTPRVVSKQSGSLGILRLDEVF
jgi:hypothetical protein